MQRPVVAKSPPPDLASLLARVALHDRAAFEALYRATSSHLLGIAFRVLGQRERAEEVLQEAYMNVWHSAASYSAAVATPMTWMINIVRNKAIDAARSGRTEKASTTALDDDFDIAADHRWEPQHLLDESPRNAAMAHTVPLSVKGRMPNREAAAAEVVIGIGDHAPLHLAQRKFVTPWQRQARAG